MDADGEVFGVLEEALAGRILAEAVWEAGHGVEPAPVDSEGAHAVEGRGLPVDGAGGRPGGAPGQLVLADLVGGQRGGPRVATEEGNEMGGPAASGAVGPELPDVVVLEVGVDEGPRVGPWGLKVRGGSAAREAPGVAVEPVSCGVMDSVPPRGGGRGQAASVHIRSDGPHREAESAEATERRCVGSHEWRPSAPVRSASPAGTPAPPCGPAAT